MAKKLVRYLLEGNGSIPVFVENGGYWEINGELVGLSVDEDLRHVPATVVRMARADLYARLELMDLKDAEGNSLDSTAKEALADSFLEQIGLADLA